MKAFMIIVGFVVVMAGFKYGPNLYVKGLKEKNRLMAKMAEPFDERKEDMGRLNKVTKPTAANAAGGGVKQSTSDILKQMKQQRKEMRGKR